MFFFFLSILHCRQRVMETILCNRLPICCLTKHGGVGSKRCMMISVCFITHSYFVSYTFFTGVFRNFWILFLFIYFYRRQHLTNQTVWLNWKPSVCMQWYSRCGKKDKKKVSIVLAITVHFSQLTFYVKSILLAKRQYWKMSLNLFQCCWICGICVI